MRMCPAGKDGKTEDKDRKGESTQEEQVASASRKKIHSGGSPVIVIHGSLLPYKDLTHLTHKPQISHSSRFHEKKGLRRKAEIPLRIEAVPKGGLESPRVSPSPLRIQVCIVEILPEG